MAATSSPLWWRVLITACAIAAVALSAAGLAVSLGIADTVKRTTSQQLSRSKTATLKALGENILNHTVTIDARLDVLEDRLSQAEQRQRATSR